MWLCVERGIYLGSGGLTWNPPRKLGGGQFYQTLGKHKFSPTPVGALPNGALKFFIFLREAKGFLG